MYRRAVLSLRGQGHQVAQGPVGLSGAVFLPLRALLTRRIVVVLEKKSFIYDFSDLGLISQHETYTNPSGMA